MKRKIDENKDCYGIGIDMKIDMKLRRKWKWYNWNWYVIMKYEGIDMKLDEIESICVYIGIMECNVVYEYNEI